MKTKKERKLESPELEEFEELIKFVSLDELIEDEIENFTAERELLNAVFSDDEF